MTQLDYAEAWLWVHFMLETTPERMELLRGYLQALRSEESPAPISRRLRNLHLDYERKLLDHLAVLSGASQEMPPGISHETPASASH